MAANGEAPIDVAELECALREADAAALMVPPRILRRVIKRDRGMTFAGWQVARRRSYVIDAEALRSIVAEDELLLWPESHWPPVAILLLRPDPHELAGRVSGDVWREYWRMLFHARVELALRRRFAEGRLTPEELRNRIERIGPTAFEEFRHVLRQEGFLLPPRDNATVYTEFAALFLELRHFTPSVVPHFFPSIEDPDAVEEMLGEDLAVADLLQATRLPGAPDPAAAEPGEIPAVEALGAVTTRPPRRGEKAARSLFRWLILHAERSGIRGNVVRAAIDRRRASLLVGPVLSVQASVGARNDLDRLVDRLQQALQLRPEEVEGWRPALPPLLDRAIHGFWTAEGRLLYDLQRVCLDHEREVFTVDMVEWLRSGCRRPLRHPLPHLREVLISNHLRSALRRLRAARITIAERARLADLLHPAVRRAETAVRDRFRPLLIGVFCTTRILPHNLPEAAAYHKLLEELLDRIVRRGFLSLGDLRDACSRSNLKLPDLSGPLEFLRGDRLLRTDRALARELEGVYRRGEIYLRALQRLSSLAFATRFGRFLTRYAALPFGGAFVALKGLQHLIEPLEHWLPQVEIPYLSEALVVVVGTVASGLINSPAFRARFLKWVQAAGAALRMLVVDLPRRLFQLRVIRQVLDSRLALVAWRFLLKPLLIAAPAGLLGAAAGIPRSETPAVIGIVFLPAMIILNSRLGRDVEEIVADSAVRIWRQLFVDIIPGLFRLILSTFDRILEGIERLLYAVDEWLRFRHGQSRAALAARAVLGLGWFLVAYLVRIYVNLLIEPQVNPIKHFPVVTVSHKLILTQVPTLTRWMAALLAPLGPKLALFIAGSTVLLLPGVFGFLVWELKENWRLYEANRSETLRPVLVGDHGETMGRFLRPGIHSGTLPKLFAKLRKSERRAPVNVDAKGAFKRLEAIHHVEDSIRRFIDRDLVALLSESRTLRSEGITTGEIHVATNQIRIELRSARGGEPPASAESSLWIELAEIHDALIARVVGPGWLPELNPEQLRILHVAIIGLFQMCGVEWVCVEPISPANGPAEAPQLASAAVSANLVEGGPIPWVNEPREAHRADREAGAGGPALFPFSKIVVTWRRWVEAWQRERAGAKHPARFIDDYSVLPRFQASRKRAPRRVAE